MKNYLSRYILLLAFVVLSFVACKKDKLEVDQEKYYVQTNAKPGAALGESYSVSLTLKPNGEAVITPGSDIMYLATYRIKGRQLTVHQKELNQKFDFTIVSDTELRGSNGEILMLQ